MRLFRSMGVDEIVVNTNKHYVEPIVRFFRIRGKRDIKKKIMCKKYLMNRYTSAA